MKFNTTILARWYQPTENWGDALNPYLINKLSGKRAVNVLYPKYNFDKIIQRIGLTKRTEYMVIGSILSWGHYRDGVAEIWGPGFMSELERLSFKPKKVHAVRGQLTRNILLQQEIDCPNVLGDPALIMPYIYNPQKIGQKYPIGIIPHYTDKVFFEKNKVIDKKIKIINIEQSIETFIEELLSCDVILSSSLHGLIAADAYSIPSCRIAINNDITGGDFKFKDYFSGIDCNYKPSYCVSNIADIYKISEKCRVSKIDKSITKRLLDSCPFLQKGINFHNE